MKKRLFFRLRPDRRSLWKDAAKTLLILLAITAVNFVMDRSVGDAQNVSELYLLSVLLISLSTSGYFWGLLGAAAGVICTNYLFTYPYYTFNFSLQGYPVTFLCMLLVAGISGTLAANVKEQRDLSQSREKKTQQLNRVAQRLLSAQTADQIGKLAAQCLFEFLQLPACFCLAGSTKKPFVCGPADGFSQQTEKLAVQAVFSGGQPVGKGCDLYSDCSGRYFPVSSGQRVLAAAGICPQGELDEESQEFLSLLLSQFAMALERQRLSDESHQMAVEKQKEQMRGNLLRAISHDLRPPDRDSGRQLGHFGKRGPHFPSGQPTAYSGYPGRRGLAFAHGGKCSVDNAHRATGIRTSEGAGSGGGSRGPGGQPVPEAAVRPFFGRSRPGGGYLIFPAGFDCGPST